MHREIPLQPDQLVPTQATPEVRHRMSVAALDYEAVALAHPDLNLIGRNEVPPKSRAWRGAVEAEKQKIYPKR